MLSKPELASAIMTRKLTTVKQTARAMDALALLLRHNISGAPVVAQGSEFMGVFSEKCCMTLMTNILSDRSTGTGRVERLKASDVMVRRLITVQADMDVFDAIGHLLKNRISGAPVVDDEQRFLGVFSEKSSMGVVVETVYGQLPSADVGKFMDADQDRLITPETPFDDIVAKFVETPYRRLPVVAGDQLLGQVSRRDVLRTFHRYSPTYPTWDDVVVNQYLDAKPATIRPDADLLSIARTFRETPYRRLPVLDGDQVVGQVSRRDLLQAIHDSLSLRAPVTADPLYLSSTNRVSPFSGQHS